MKRPFAAGFGALAVLLLAGCSDRRAQTTTPPPAPAPQPRTITVSGAPGEIPAGTAVEVRTNEAINSGPGAEGRTYAAEIATDIVTSSGEVLIPKGSQAELVVLETRQGGGIKGPGVQLGLRSVTVRGTNYMVVSQEVERSGGLGRNRRTAEMVGGGAALGTLIGAAAGGGKGAVLGGLIGAAAGAAAQVLTQGKEVRIPAETLLRFQLDEPMHLQRANTNATP